MEANRNCSGAAREIEGEEAIKRRILSHPLYEKLVQNHLECLQVGGVSISIEERNERIKDVLNEADHHDRSPRSSILEQSELDVFMEAYCAALSKLREAMEEPQQQTIAFISNMHSQLTKLSCTTPTPQPDDDDDALLAAEFSIASIDKQEP